VGTRLTNKKLEEHNQQKSILKDVFHWEEQTWQLLTGKNGVRAWDAWPKVSITWIQADVLDQGIL